MKNIATISTIIVGGASMFGSSEIKAQTLGAEYTTEWQTDFKGGYDWLNLLHTSAQIPVFSTLSLEASTISVAKSGDDTLIPDLLTFSNIEAGNIPLTIARLGLNLSVKSAELFVGVNNVNEDYFTSELTSFFTNSSCGISPTLSCNYDIANYPMASWCVHYRQHIGAFTVQTSLYPGKGYYRLAGHDNLFNLNVKRDGIFSISSIDYQRHDINLILGIGLYHGVCIGDEERWAQGWAQEPQKKWSVAPWILTEMNLTDRLGMHVHASVSSVKHGCRDYAGFGLVYKGKKVQPGVSFNYATFTDAEEYDLELTARIPLLDDRVALQPAFHLIGTDGHSPQCVALLRLQVAI